MLRIVLTRRLATARVLRKDAENKIGLVDFFRPSEEWAEPDQAETRKGFILDDGKSKEYMLISVLCYFPPSKIKLI